MKKAIITFVIVFFNLNVVLAAHPLDPFQVLLPTLPSSQATHAFEDPNGAVAQVDSLLAHWSFDDAFKLGDSADYFAPSCSGEGSEMRCTLVPLHLEVMDVTDKGAAIVREFRGDSNGPDSFFVSREFFEKNKNVLRTYLEKVETKPACVLTLGRGTLITEHLGNSPHYEGMAIDFACKNSSDPQSAGHFFFGIKTPWVAQIGSLTHSGNGLPWVVLREFSRL